MLATSFTFEVRLDDHEIREHRYDNVPDLAPTMSELWDEQRDDLAIAGYYDEWNR